jgi:hypothetical protein
MEKTKSGEGKKKKREEYVKRRKKMVGQGDMPP